MRAFWKKGCKKQGSSAHEKGQFFSNFEFPGKMTDFAGLFWSDHLTYNNSPGISGKIISISFICNPVFRNCVSGEAALTSKKSGLLCSAFKMLISVLSNKANSGGSRDMQLAFVICSFSFLHKSKRLCCCCCHGRTCRRGQGLYLCKSNSSCQRLLQLLDRALSRACILWHWWDNKPEEDSTATAIFQG